MVKYYLSVDPGIKNFGISFIKLDDTININTDVIENVFNDNDYTIIKIENININNKKGDDVYLKLINYFNKLICGIKLNKNDTWTILTEYQMNINYKTNIIYNIIITYFHSYFMFNDFKNYKIVSIKPTYKNIISQSIDPEQKLRIKYIKQYIYNKKLVELYFIELNKKYNFIDIKKSIKMDDIADSFIQILSYFKFYY